MFRSALVRLAARDRRVWCCDSDMGGLLGSFGTELPEQYVDVGIAEAALMGVAAGLAAGGKIPFVHTMASFAMLRAGEQVKVDIAYNRLPVHIAATHGGLSGGLLGPTHHALEDLAVARALPHMTVVVPSDNVSAAALVPLLVELPGPSYSRLERRGDGDPSPVSDEPFVLGRARRLRAGGDVTIVACGPHPVRAALDAAGLLGAAGISARVLEMATLKPLDGSALLDAATATGRIVTVEEHNVIGGLGSAVAEVLSEQLPVPVRRIGVRDRFSTYVGDHAELLRHHRITDTAVAAAAADLCGVAIGDT
ncbi:transketolase family protein [Streptomyces sp. NPDC093591]|uniref:transketolase family protein n=1 Tax=Streptomyces sp. NPDC093591 TaxID=3366044 RepID=UPI00381B43D3